MAESWEVDLIRSPQFKQLSPDRQKAVYGEARRRFGSPVTAPVLATAQNIPLEEVTGETYRGLSPQERSVVLSRRQRELEPPPARAAGQFTYGLINEALLGLPHAIQKRAGILPEQFEEPSIARGIGGLAGFTVGGPGRLMAATGRALLKPVVRATAPIAGRGLRHLAARSLLGGAKAGAGLGATGVGPTVSGEDVQAIPKRTLYGGLLGAPLEGIIAPAVAATWKGATRMLGRPPSDKALADMSSRVLRQYPHEVRKRAFGIKQQRIEEKFAPSEAKLEAGFERIPSRKALAETEAKAKTQQSLSRIEQEGQQMADFLKQQTEQLDKALVGQQYQAAQKIQQTLPATMRNLSDRYGALRDSGLQKAEGVAVSEQELYQELSSELASDPRALNTASEIFRIGKRGPLGTKGRLPQVSKGEVRLKTGELTLEDLPPEVRGQLLQGGEPVTAEDLMNGIQAVRSNISRARRAGERMYDYDDMVLDDISEAIMNIVKRRAPPEAVKDFEAASSLWREWAPIRNRAFREFDPFIGQPIGLKPGMQSLKAAAAAEDPTATRFISELERFSEVPPGTFTGEIQNTLSSMSANERAAAADRVVKALAQEQAELSGSRALANIERGFGGEKESLVFQKQALAEEKAGRLGRLAQTKERTESEIARIRRIQKIIGWAILGGTVGSPYFRTKLVTEPLAPE